MRKVHNKFYDDQDLFIKYKNMEIVFMILLKNKIFNKNE